MPSGEYPYTVYASPFLHGCIRGSTNSCTTALELTRWPINCGTDISLWAKEVATRNIDEVPNVGSSPMAWNLTYIL